jgi:hypothetical protein
MEQRQGQAPVSGAAAKVGDVAGDLAGRSEKLVQDKMDQVKPVLQDLQESAAAAMEKVADLAQRASTVGFRRLMRSNMLLGTSETKWARPPPRPSSRRACRRIRQSIRCRTAADGAVRCRRNRVRGSLPNPPVLACCPARSRSA